MRDGGCAGSDQDKPSSEHVDTGVDTLVKRTDGTVDYTKAARLVVWTNKMNEFILPVAVVSFRIDSAVEEEDDDGDEETEEEEEEEEDGDLYD